MSEISTRGAINTRALAVVLFVFVFEISILHNLTYVELQYNSYCSMCLYILHTSEVKSFAQFVRRPPLSLLFTRSRRQSKLKSQSTEFLCATPTARSRLLIRHSQYSAQLYSKRSAACCPIRGASGVTSRLATPIDRATRYSLRHPPVLWALPVAHR